MGSPLQSDEAKIRHLLRRFGMGAGPGDVARYGGRGYAAAVDRLIDECKEPDVWNFNAQTFRNRQNNNINVRNAQYDVYGRYVCSNRPLELKLSLFWHDHFATSGQKVDSGVAMGDHFETLRINSLSYFQTLLTAVSKDPAMIYWLDSQENIKGKPNENFSREVMELFTLGIGNYTEEDVREAARAFTGWTVGYKRGNRTVTIRNQIPRSGSFFYFDQANHDFGVKTLLDNKGPFDGEDVLGILAGRPRTAAYIATKALEWFCYPHPEAKLVERVAGEYRANGLNSKALVRAIALAPEFLSAKAHRAIVKNPIDFAVATSRQLGHGPFLLANFDPEKDQRENPKSMQIIGTLLTGTSTMGMELYYPPDVAGWTSGAGWVSTATMVERIKWAQRLMNLTASRETIWQLLEQDPTPAGIASKLFETWDAEPDDDALALCAQAVSKVTGGKAATQRSCQQAAYQVARLLFGSPGFQMM